MAREEPVSTMSLEAMADVVGDVVARYPGVQAQPTIRNRSGESLITRIDAPQRWTKIEFGVEVFVLHIDAGFQLVAFEDTAQGQEESLSKFAEAACLYLDNQFSIKQERSMFGRKRDVLIVQLKSAEKLLLMKR
jgi:hypothetical protein